MRKLALLLTTVGAATALAVPVAHADSPHFVRADGTLNSDGTLDVSFKEAGLGTNQLITYVAAADGTAVYVCVNKGGANPSASNKTTVSGPVSATGQFSSGKNGQVTAELTLNPPSSAAFSCPPGQTAAVASVTYTGVTITDVTNNVSESLGDFSSGCLLPNVRGAC